MVRASTRIETNYSPASLFDHYAGVLTSDDRSWCSSEGRLVEKPVDGADTVICEHDDVEANRHGLGPGRPGVPREAGLIVVGVHRSGHAKEDARKLPLHAGDECVETRTTAHGSERIGVLTIRGVKGVDRGASPRRVGLVPNIDVRLDD